MRALRRAFVLGALLAPLLGAGLTAAAGPPDSYSGAEIRGWVVDAETKQPLAGVHVVAQWILDTGLFHAMHVTRLHIQETITDAQGDFYLPPWGPKPRPALSRLDTSDPLLTFFKPGYRPLDRANGVPHDDPVRTSRWHGKTIALQPFRESVGEWARALWLVQNHLEWGQQSEGRPWQVNQYWKHMPRIVLAVVEQRRLLPKRLQYRVWDLDTWHVTEQELRALAERAR
jgi:hypothetical protein